MPERAIEPPSDSLADFDVVSTLTPAASESVNGLMLHCRRCGVHHWQPVRERRLAELVEQAIAHRKVCHGEG